MAWWPGGAAALAVGGGREGSRGCSVGALAVATMGVGELGGDGDGLRARSGDGERARRASKPPIGSELRRTSDAVGAMDVALGAEADAADVNAPWRRCLELLPNMLAATSSTRREATARERRRRRRRGGGGATRRATTRRRGEEEDDEGGDEGDDGAAAAATEGRTERRWRTRSQSRGARCNDLERARPSPRHTRCLTETGRRERCSPCARLQPPRLPPFLLLAWVHSRRCASLASLAASIRLPY